jgi:hypothetical protein
MDLKELEVAAKRHERRRRIFMRDGLSFQAAFELAEQLFDRDQDSSDDRRLCYECNHFDEKGKACLKQLSNGRPLKVELFTLRRCGLYMRREYA